MGERSTISFLFGFSLLFLFFFLIYTRDRLMGFFSLATIGLALRPLFTSNFLILNFMQVRWEWIIRWEYLGLYLLLTGALVCRGFVSETLQALHGS
jgi:hypothetical protein